MMAPSKKVMRVFGVEYQSKMVLDMMALGIEESGPALVYSHGQMATKNKVNMTLKIKDKEFISAPLPMAPNSRYYTKTTSKLVSQNQCEFTTETIEAYKWPIVTKCSRMD